MNRRDDDATASDLLTATVDAMAEQRIAFLWFGMDKEEFEEYVGETVSEREWNTIMGSFEELHQPLDDGDMIDYICSLVLRIARDESSEEV
jgi:hypothetical protein